VQHSTWAPGYALLFLRTCILDCSLQIFVAVMTIIVILIADCSAVTMEGSYREARNLKELLLVNLDLIERQQELLVEKDKRIQHLLHENDTVSLVA